MGDLRALACLGLLALASPARAGRPAPDGTGEPSGSTWLGAEPESPVDPDARRYRLRPVELKPPDLAAVPTDPPERSLLLSWGEALGANLVIWSFDRFVFDEAWARVSTSTWRANLRGSWVYDPNDFTTNQFGHPYQGGLSFAAARATGFNFWEALPYPLVASTLWELFGENEPPSLNDAITTPVAGAFLGEALFRLGNMVLDAGGERPGAWREWGAAAVSPMTGLTRLLRRDRYRSRPDDPIPAAIELRLGGSVGGYSYAARRTTETGGMVSVTLQVTHGLPVHGWRPRQAFDHFDLTATFVATHQPWGVLWVRGLLAGQEFDGAASRAMTGLWGIYETATPDQFRASTSAIGFGTVAQRWWPGGLALQGTALVAGGFGAAGSREAAEGTADYRFGLNVLALVEAKVIAADRGALRISGRQYVIGDALSPDQGRELITYGTFGATLRVVGRHAFGLDALIARRSSRAPGRDEVFNRFSQVVATYTLVTDKTLGSGLEPVVAGSP